MGTEEVVEVPAAVTTTGARFYRVITPRKP